MYEHSKTFGSLDLFNQIVEKLATELLVDVSLDRPIQLSAPQSQPFRILISIAFNKTTHYNMRFIAVFKTWLT